MHQFQRVFLIVVDSLGIGEMQDSAAFGDVGVNTLGHISESRETFEIPNLVSLGISNLLKLKQYSENPAPKGYFGSLSERSNGKDTMIGHWEMMGLYTAEPFITFTEHGFPAELIEQLEKETGRHVIGNKSASGTEILEELGEEEVQHGHLIVYTSSDSVMQICGNEETMGLEALYHYCQLARRLTEKKEWRVGRVIARPYTGIQKGTFHRTSNRRDFALLPSGLTALDALKEAGLDVISVGKINDIFSGRGITRAIHSDSSVQGMEQTIELAGEEFYGLCFVNLVDFDTLWGHRRNPKGYGDELERFDEKLGKLISLMGKEDLLMITADHGNDPTYRGTDHTREQVPLLIYSPALEAPYEKSKRKLGAADTFAVVGATIAENFGVEMPEGTIGKSILKELK